MNSRDIRTETYTNESSIKKMRLTRIPTGKCVEGEGRLLYKLRKDLVRQINAIPNDQNGV